MRAESLKDDDDSEVKKWTCLRCASWCLAEGDDVYMAAWLLQGREWPR